MRLCQPLRPVVRCPLRLDPKRHALRPLWNDTRVNSLTLCGCWLALASASRMSAVCAGPFGAVRLLDRPSWLMAAPDRISCGPSARGAAATPAAALQRTSEEIITRDRGHTKGVWLPVDAPYATGGSMTPAMAPRVLINDVDPLVAVRR